MILNNVEIVTFSTDCTSTPGAIAAVVLTMDVEFMKVFTAPIEDELEDVMELGESGVAVHKESAPDERADAAQDDTKLINVG